MTCSRAHSAAIHASSDSFTWQKGISFVAAHALRWFEFPGNVASKIQMPGVESTSVSKRSGIVSEHLMTSRYASQRRMHLMTSSLNSKRPGVSQISKKLLEDLSTTCFIHSIVLMYAEVGSCNKVVLP